MLGLPKNSKLKRCGHAEQIEPGVARYINAPETFGSICEATNEVMSTTSVLYCKHNRFYRYSMATLTHDIVEYTTSQFACNAHRV